MTLRDNLNIILSEKFSLNSKLGDKSKLKKNDIINDVPSIDTLKDQTFRDPRAPTSTVGLIGFENDKLDVKDSIILGQNQDEESYYNLIKDQTFGTIQVNFEEDGGTQTKSVNVPHTLVGNISQEELAKMTAKDKLRVEELFKKFSLSQATEPIHQLKPNQLIQNGKTDTAQKTILKGTGVRNALEQINRIMQGKIGSIKSSMPKVEKPQKESNSKLEDLAKADLDQVSL